ncbi:MAG: DUF4112 domain-containing protein [Thermoanaerobaculia bacterium]
MASRISEPQAGTSVAVSEKAARVRALARMLDSAIRIPGTGVTFGLDPILGLVPGIGDLAGAVFSGYIVLTAARMGAPRSVLARMLLNLGTDTLVGSIPVLGDLFDVGFRANIRNSELLDKHLGEPEAARRSSRFAIAVTAAGLLVLAVVAVGIAILSVKGLNWLVRR